MRNEKVEVVRYKARSKDDTEGIDLVTVDVNSVGLTESFNLETDLAEDLFGIKLKPGERATYEVPKWIKRLKKLKIS